MLFLIPIMFINEYDGMYTYNLIVGLNINQYIYI